ncbi:MAG: sn-glycerol-3-phosphate ABC transporter ATP-binding protein UgpC [Atopococcus tabaci]|uniref:Sn-glycerol-3-phosphate ABC transporter ATP-binding protein UgpC n=1 Tax=Atopococcus tabaci TaxID=269774 RepID=A0AA43RK48_9LACT|nr:sn-glycerol-3-phosphate ABC transporter ATP-binding protein UgpC [Atopococcus tabaci]
MEKIKLNLVSKKYPNQEDYVIENLNLSIQDKEFLVLVGPSGSGKSTTLRLIAGLESITSGDLLIDDQINNDVPSKDRDIAMVFQNYALFPHMTVEENIGYGLKVRGEEKESRKEKIADAADVLGLTPYLSRKPKDLSGGQMQRVALGRAIVRDASIFLMDEPLSNLDAKLRSQMREEIIQLHQKLGSTVIYVTHDQEEAMTMADRIVVMDQGRIMQIGSPSEIYNHPQNTFVANFMGSPEMNMFDAVITKEMIQFDHHTLKQTDLLFQKDSEEREIIFAIRPENISEVPKEQADVISTISFVEITGADSFVHVEFGDSTLIYRSHPSIQSKRGDLVGLSFDLKKAHLFSRESGKLIH